MLGAYLTDYLLAYLWIGTEVEGEWDFAGYRLGEGPARERGRAGASGGRDCAPGVVASPSRTPTYADVRLDGETGRRFGRTQQRGNPGGNFGGNCHPCRVGSPLTPTIYRVNVVDATATEVARDRSPHYG